jgi:hypothetical protein
MSPAAPVNDVIVIDNTEVSHDNLSSGLRSAFDRAIELATRHNLVGPFRLTLTDADARQLLTMAMSCYESSWTGQTEPGELEMRGGIAFPWILTLEDSSGRELRICLALGPQSRLM